MVIDDDEDLREALVMALEGEGWTAIAGGTFDEVAHELAEKRPCALVVDLHLAGQDAADVITWVREAAGSPIPAVLASGAQDIDRLAERIGANAAILKPFTVGELIALLRPLCQP